MKKYQAVIGDDIETTSWGASNESAHLAIINAITAFSVDGCMTLVKGREYLVTVYDSPVHHKHPSGEFEVVGWADRGEARVVYAIKGFHLSCSLLSLTWDGVAVTP